MSCERSNVGKAGARLVLFLAVLAALLALVLVREETSERPAVGMEIPLQDLPVEEVTQIQFLGDGVRVTLREESADAWAVVDKDDYPVDAERLRRFILSATSLQVVDRVTEDPAKYETLGVAEPPAQGVIRFLAQGGEPLAVVYVGRAREAVRTRGAFVRVEGDPAVYATGTLPPLAWEPSGWLDRQVLQLSPDEVVRIEVVHADSAEDFVVSRVTPGEPFTLDPGPPQGRTLRSGAVSAVSRALSNLVFTDVFPADSPQVASSAFPTRFRAETRQGIAYTVEADADGESHHIRVLAAPVPEKDGDVERPQEVDSRVEDFNRRAGPWVYRVSEATHENLVKGLTDLTEPSPEQ